MTQKQTTQQNGQQMQTRIADVTLERVLEMQAMGTIDIPENYSPGNALKSAWLILQDTIDKEKKPVLESCTRDSIYQALFKMVVLGLNPAKKQCYFIAYGKQLACDESYFGVMATAKRVHQRIPEDGFSYAVVYQGDDFEFERRRGKVRIIKHGQKLENVNKGNILAAYCEIYDDDDKLISSELMTIDEIKQAWMQSRMNPVDENGRIKPSSTHGKFAADMCLKTVIRKACKPIINSSDDKNLNLLRKQVPGKAELKAAEEIEDNAGKETVGFSDAEVEVVDEQSEERAAIPENVDMQTGEVFQGKLDTAQHATVSAAADPGF